MCLQYVQLLILEYIGGFKWGFGWGGKKPQKCDGYSRLPLFLYILRGSNIANYISHLCLYSCFKLQSQIWSYQFYVFIKRKNVLETCESFHQNVKKDLLLLLCNGRADLLVKKMAKLESIHSSSSFKKTFIILTSFIGSHEYFFISWQKNPQISNMTSRIWRFIQLYASCAKLIDEIRLLLHNNHPKTE